MSYDRGTYQLQCVKPGGCTLTAYAQYAFDEGEVVDLLDDATPETLRASDYPTAQTMCEDSGFEIAQRVKAGEFRIGERRYPLISVEEE